MLAGVNEDVLDLIGHAMTIDGIYKPVPVVPVNRADDRRGLHEIWARPDN
jgi:hypothetical protein